MLIGAVKLKLANDKELKARVKRERCYYYYMQTKRALKK